MPKGAPLRVLARPALRAYSGRITCTPPPTIMPAHRRALPASICLSMCLLMLAAIAALAPRHAAAQAVYRCTTPAGELAFQDRPCSRSAQGGPVHISQPNIVQADLAGVARMRAADAERSALQRGHVLPGMHAATVLQAWGRPDRVNTSMTADGTTRHQLVYRAHDGGRRYVYVEANTVTGYQYTERYR